MRTRLHTKGYIQQICEVVGGIVGISLEILIGFLLLISKLLFRFRIWLYRLGIILFILINAYTTFLSFADAPKAQAAHTTPYVADHPVSEHDEIVAYINTVFGSDAPKAFQLLSCENHALNPEALNDNTTWGGRGKDWGIFQVNDSWQGVSGRFLTNWKVNILIAYQIYTESGRNFHLWTCGRKFGI